MPSTAEILAVIRKRHGLDDDADVRVRSMSMKAEIGDDTHSFTARITTATLDRDAEVILPQGVDATEFNKSGAVFWNHDYDQPVAIARKVRQGDRDIVSTASFMERPADWQGEWRPDFARAFVSQMAKHGKETGVSIGFIPVEFRKPTTKDIETYGAEVRNVITQCRLLEWSIAPVQSNPDATVMRVGKALGAVACKCLGLPDPGPAVVEDVIEVKHEADRIVVIVPRPKRARPADDTTEIAVEKAVARARGSLWI